ncbi:transporter substrate-binding domain-containing protein [Pseudaeromonas sp. ZJS20]|uniref:substrate-binding periplasmic protein n=1 Tax=Pseudaeromonas aegiceratis TaxID=3153928 RepID=UPI00390C5CA7
MAVMRGWWAGAALLLGSGCLAQEISFNMGPAGYPPYMILPSQGLPARGIMLDVLQRASGELGLSVTPRQFPRKRVNLALAAHDLDVTPRAMEWEPKASQYAFTQPVLMLGDVLFCHTRQPQNLADLHGLILGTKLGYAYPELASGFLDGEFTRQDAKTELAMLRKVLAHRTDCAVVNQAVGQWLIRANPPLASLHMADVGLPKVGFRFMFRQEDAPQVQALDRVLGQLAQSGELQRIIGRYLP